MSLKYEKVLFYQFNLKLLELLANPNAHNLNYQELCLLLIFHEIFLFSYYLRNNITT